MCNGNVNCLQKFSSHAQKYNWEQGTEQKFSKQRQKKASAALQQYIAKNMITKRQCQQIAVWVLAGGQYDYLQNNQHDEKCTLCWYKTK